MAAVVPRERPLKRPAKSPPSAPRPINEKTMMGIPSFMSILTHNPTTLFSENSDVFPLASVAVAVTCVQDRMEKDAGMVKLPLESAFAEPMYICPSP
jgi:hypothetical protein